MPSHVPETWGAGALQEKHGYTRDEAVRELDAFSPGAERV
jgi:hypothetical protein